MARVLIVDDMVSIRRIVKTLLYVADGKTVVGLPARELIKRHE